MEKEIEICLCLFWSVTATETELLTAAASSAASRLWESSSRHGRQRSPPTIREATTVLYCWRTA